MHAQAFKVGMRSPDDVSEAAKLHLGSHAACDAAG